MLAVVAPFGLTHAAEAYDLSQSTQNPSGTHILGTDALGRDIALRILVATRLSLMLALACTALGAVSGIPLGAAATLLPPRPRAFALRTIDTLLAFPGIIVAIFVSAVLGLGALSAVIGVGVWLSFSFARLASTLTMSIGGRDFVKAAHVLGVSRTRLLFRYVIPNVAETFCVTTAVSVSTSLIVVSSLSFLGLGVQAPQFDWGQMLTNGVDTFYLTPASALGPAAAIAITALAFGIFGEALAHALNPLVWTQSGSSRGGLLADGISASDDEEPARTDGVPILSVDNLGVAFHGRVGSKPVVAGVSFSLRRGEILGIVGESGSGKTMTALAISQLVPYPGKVTGAVSLNGQDLRLLSGRAMNRFLATHLAVVFQDPMASLNPALHVGIQLSEGAEVHRRLPHQKAISLAAARLREVKLPVAEQVMHHYPAGLSGGMRQRVMLAMSLMNEPSLLIADETTSALDVTIQAQIMELLTELNSAHGMSIILISHNLALVSGYCDRVLVMYAGRIVEDAITEHLLDSPRHPYTRALLGAVPSLRHPRNVPLDAIPGYPPDLASAPPGCAFAPRCPLAIARCREIRPPLRRLENGDRVACWLAEDVS